VDHKGHAFFSSEKKLREAQALEKGGVIIKSDAIPKLRVLINFRVEGTKKKGKREKEGGTIIFLSSRGKGRANEKRRGKEDGEDDQRKSLAAALPGGYRILKILEEQIRLK